MKTLALITNIPTPYRVPFFNHLAKYLAANGVFLEVIFAAQSYARRQWQIPATEFEFKHHFLEASQQININSGESAAFDYSGLGLVLKRLKPSWIVSSGYGICTAKALAYGLPRSTPVFIWSGEIVNPHRQVSLMRRAYRRVLLNFARGGIAYGKAAKDYLYGMGMAEKKISIARNTVDVSFYSSISRHPTEPQRLLIVGNLEKLKRVEQAIHVVSELSKLSQLDYRVDVIGTGSEESALKCLVKDLGLSDRILFHGFQQKHELAKFYSQASLLLFPSEYDIWGLVMVESLAAGVPVISSKFPGAAAELIVSGETGEIVDFQNYKSVALKIELLLQDQALLRRMSAQCRAFALEKLTLRSMAEGFAELWMPSPDSDAAENNRVTEAQEGKEND